MSALGRVAAALIALRLAAELGLSALNRAEVRRRAGSPPPAAAAVMDPPTYARAGAYAIARSRFGDARSAFDAAVLAAVLFSGILPALAAWTGGAASAGRGALFLVLAGALLAAPSLPFDWWEHFRIEAEFGFNRGTTGLWVADRLKGFALALAVGFPLLWALVALVDRCGRAWWVAGWALVCGVQFSLLVLFPKVILPLFNRLEPLPEGELRSRLLALAARMGLRAASIQVMDGSRRSSHANALFLGFGRFRRIVLFDTLVEQLSAEELEAVLAHEVGHWRRGHARRRLALSAAALFGGFAAAGWLVGAPWFERAFGFPAGQPAPALLLAGIFGGLVAFWLSPLESALSRRHEYEADAFAREATGGPGPLVGALRKLTGKNLSNPTPHPWFSAFYYSHPTLVERERALTG